MIDPLHQFEIKKIFNLKIAGFLIPFTNSALFMSLAAFLAIGLFLFGMRHRHIIPNRIQALVESLYDFISGMIHENIGPAGKPYFPLVLSLFLFILFGNLLGMIPYSFTFTSHIIVTFSLAILIFGIVFCVGILKHRLHFFSIFMPKGAPLVMAPLLIPIEILSFFSRPFSLAVRLFANMMAGHIILKVFAGFAVALGVFGVVPIVVNAALMSLELLVACIQAYMFTILTCLYINDAIHLH